MAGVEVSGKYRIKPPYTAARLAPNEFLLKGGLWGGLGFVLKDRDDSGLLAGIVERLDGDHTVGEIFDALGADRADEARDLLDQLLKSELIEEAPAPPAGVAADTGAHARFMSMTTFLSCITNQPRAVAAARLHGARVAVIGAGAIGARVALQLAQTGIRRLRLVDDAKSTPADRHRTPWLGRAGGHRTRGETVAAAVAELIPESDVLTQEGGLDGAIDDSDFAIVASDGPDLTLYQRFNEAALGRRLTWSMVTLDGVDGLVGPTFKPFETCCAICYQLRLESNLKFYDQYIKVRDASLSAGNGNGHGSRDHGFPIGLTSVADILAGFATYDCVRALSTEYCFTFGRALRINFQSGMIELNDVLKLPRCPACGKLARGVPSHQAYNTFEQVIRDLGV